jgi:glyoxylase I family protein
MIIGLTHVGMTVSAMERSLHYYQEMLGLTVLSDAERQGEWIEKITGIPGFHTRTVYMSVSARRHIEAFGFFHPKTVPPEKEISSKVGIQYLAFRERKQAGRPSLKGSEKEDWPRWIMAGEEDPYSGSPASTLRDPDGMLLRVVEGREPMREGFELLYPAVMIEELERSVLFYRDALGLEVESEGGESAEGKNPRPAVRWVLLRGETGPCLKLIQPLNFKISPPSPWVMQRVGFSHIAFGVREIDRYYSALLEKKVSFKSPPTPINVGPHEGGKVIYLNGPEGITLEFIDSPLIQREDPC